VPEQRPARPDARWRPALDRLGFADVPSYLQERHVRQHRTVNAMAAEIGVTHHAVESALRRHGLDRVAHASTRRAATERATQVAARLGSDSLGSYLRERRAAGWTWRAMAAESGQLESWLRRHAARGPEECKPGGLGVVSCWLLAAGWAAVWSGWLGCAVCGAPAWGCCGSGGGGLGMSDAPGMVAV